MPACPASFLKERFPISGNDKRCAIAYYVGLEGGFLLVPLSWYIMFSAVIFSIGVLGFVARRNLIIVFLSIELMLNSVNISLAAFSHYLQSMTGQILVFLVITVAAAEAAIGLAILIALYKNKPTIKADEINFMKG
jgi:NADH-quinone oxidoreductase subunit K